MSKSMDLNGLFAFTPIPAYLTATFSALQKYCCFQVRTHNRLSWHSFRGTGYFIAMKDTGRLLSFELSTDLLLQKFKPPSAEFRLPLLSSGQSSWLQVYRSRYDSRRYQIFWEVVCLERGPLSLVSTTEELLGRKCWGFRSRNSRTRP
jgi:hypothetical protein